MLQRNIANTLRRGLRQAKFTGLLFARNAPIRAFSSTPLRLNAQTDNKSATIKVDDPQLMIAFTCKKCDTRSSHVFSKQAYYKGSVLIQCPGCKNRHLIADNLKIFRDENFNLEEFLKAQGKSVSTTTEDLVFEDIPESLRKTIGHHAKDAPEEYREKECDEIRALPDSEKKD